MSELAQRLASLSPQQRQLLEKRLAQKNLPEKPTAEPIAIVGMSCRFAGARNLAEFWRVISEGIEATREVPADRWDIDELYDPTGTESGKMSTRWGGFIDDIDQFDPAFFGIAPREAARMDPQQRLLLEVAWETLENAGLPADKMAGTNTAVYVGIGGTDYSKVPAQFADYFHHIDAHVGTGNALSIASNRVSYIFDFHGPSASVDTACSSSSLAIHLAVESLRRGEATAALAGGVNAIITPETTIAFSKARMLSPEGKCRPFDSRANGYVRGEGCGLVLLKKLSDAERDGDNILGVIRATSVNQDGRTSGISAPNGESQKLCIRAALAQAGITADDVGYIEAHGTGTPLGDPIEMQALCEIFRGEPDTNPLYVTSVKANIGHTETVSGVAGLIKTMLLMQHDTLVPQLHFQKLNPHISLAGSRVVIPTERNAWPADQRRLAGISSFGFGGTNTHLIVEGLPATTEPKPAKPSNGRATVKSREEVATFYTLKLSGRTASAVTRQAKQLAEVFATDIDSSTLELCYAANTSRCDFNHRAAVVGDSRAALVEQLQLLAAEQQGPGIRQGSVKGLKRSQVAMLFTGQGSQYAGMGRELYETERVFREAIDQCATALLPLMDVPLLTLLYPGRDDDPARIDNTIYTQPCLVSLEYAAAQLWRSWGVVPKALLGHSVGEYAAAIVGGAMSLEDGLSLIAHRAQLMQRVTAVGKMAAVFASEAEVAREMAGESNVTIATVNGPANTVISGDADAVDKVVKQFAEKGLSVQPLNVSHAFHSHHMDSVLDEFEAFAARLEFFEPSIPIVSNVTGVFYDGAPDARYWRNHLRGAVRFSDGVEMLARADANLFIEVGPSASLVGMVKRCMPAANVHLIATMRKGNSSAQSAAIACAEFYTAGGVIDWRALAGPRPPRRVAIPNYPFDRARYWLERNEAAERTRTVKQTGKGNPLLGSRQPSVWSSALYETVIDATRPAFLADHQVQGSVVVPAAAFVDQALAAAQATFGDGQHIVENLSVQHAMFLPEGAKRLMQVAVAPESGGETTIECYSTLIDEALAENDPTWMMHAAATIKHADKASLSELPTIDLAAIRSRLDDHKTRDEFYQIVAHRGLIYGPQFQVLGEVNRSSGEALATLQPHEHVVAEASRYKLHPVLGDACLQTLASTVPLEDDGSYSPYTYMPVSVRQACVIRPIESFDTPLYCFAVRRSDQSGPSPEFVESDVVIVDGTGVVFVALLGARVQRIGRGKQVAPVDPADWLYQVDWIETPLATADPKAGGALLIFADSRGVADAVIENLTPKIERLIVVRAGKRYDTEESGSRVDVVIDPLDADHYERLFKEYFADGRCDNVVHLWSVDVDGDAREMWSTARRLSTGASVQLLKRAVRHNWKKLPRVWFVTEGAQIVESQAEVAVAQAPLVGLVRVAQMEHPELKPTLLDLDPAASPSVQAAAIIQECLSAGGDQQIAYRNQVRKTATLVDSRNSIATAIGKSDQLKTPSGSAYQLRFQTAGSFDSLRFVPIQRKKPEAGEVEVEVHATGLNFSDVLKALGLYPGIKDAIVPLGIEASGVVTAIGDNVDRFRVGQAVMGVAPYAFGSHTITPEYTLVAKPETLTHVEAATIPITYLTAYYALVRLADMQAGERLLIHAGAGGVGLAAIQIAQHRDVEIYATAGSDEKRDYLRSLGVAHVYSSRSLDFYDQILADTGREGVDIVLNSLPGEAIAKSLQLLRAYGRFLEIGKIDIYQNRMIGLLPFQDNLSYHAIDLDRLLRQRSDFVRQLFAEVMTYFESKSYGPLRHTMFTRDRTVDAFRYMSARKNIGKIVVDMTATSGDQTSSDTQTTQTVRSDASYLVTGGVGALGLKVAEWLAENGAGGLVLVSRRGEPTSGTAADVIAALRSRGLTVHCLAVDVADRDALKHALEKLPKSVPPIRGVIHAAGVLADGVLADMSLDALDKAMLPKTVGAWNLHEATSQLPLDFFVMFSSVATILGSPGQANYAAGNAALDALAHYRRSRGLPATSINWGPWADSGMAAEQGRGDGIQARGMDLLSATESLQLMGQLIESGVTQATVMDAHWDVLVRILGNRRPQLLDALAASRADGQLPEDSGSRIDRKFRERLDAAAVDDHVPMLRDYIQRELARIMSFEPDQLDTTQPLAAFGLDSLMALELKNNLEARLDFTLPMAKLLEGPSISSLATDVASLLASDDAITPRGVASNWTPFVELKKGDNSLAPLVLFPALGGDVRYYAPLVHLLKTSRQVLAFRPRGIDDANPPHSDIESVTVDYVAALRVRQPDGPYFLAGWSAGGVTAFAIAAALRDAGDEVAMLALFDTPLPSIYRDVDPDDSIRFLCDLVTFTNRFAGTNIVVSYDKLREVSAEQGLAIAIEQVRQQGVFHADISDEHVHRLIAAGVGMVRASQQFTPKPIDMAMHLFQPEIDGGLFDISGHVQAEDLGWNSEVGQQLIRKTIAGDHFTMMTGEGARQLAAAFDEILG